MFNTQQELSVLSAPSASERAAFFVEGCRWTLAAVACLLLWLSSCHRTTEDVHLEHHTPAHRPQSYRAAVAELRSRIEETLSTGSVDDDNSRRFSELGDIIRWLPEIAAESDLRKGDWNQVQRVAQDLEVWHEQRSTLKETSEEQQGAVERGLTTLESLVDKSERDPAFLRQQSSDEVPQ